MIVVPASVNATAKTVGVAEHPSEAAGAHKKTAGKEDKKAPVKKEAPKKKAEKKEAPKKKVEKKEAPKKKHAPKKAEKKEAPKKKVEKKVKAAHK